MSGEEEEVKAAVRDSAELLSSISDLRLIFKYAKWIFEVDPESASTIFTSNKRKDPLPVEDVLGFLGGTKNATLASVRFLEHVVFEQKRNDEKFHTKLALVYVDVVLPLAPKEYEGRRPEAGSEPGDLGKYRGLLIKLLEFSNHFNPGLVLQKIKDTVLYEEQVLCYTKLGLHEDALGLLFHKVRSYQKATDHCLKFNASSDVNLFLVLLKVYLQLVKDGEMPKAVVKLLNDFPQHLRPDEVVPLLPSTLKIHQMDRYLNESLRHNMSKLCSGQVEKNLRKADLYEQQLRNQKITGRHLMIDSSVKCAVCKTPIGDAMFVWYPNNVICHFKCKTYDHICPVTGRDFKKKPATENDLIKK